MASESFDVIIIGAGASGIGAGVRLKQMCPSLSFCVLERRADLGGTWDFFKYPGIRSDSHMWGYSFPFRPWTHPKIIAPGSVIKSYLRDTSDEFKVTPHIRFEVDVASADFHSEDDRWQLVTLAGVTFSCQFLIMATGYYDYHPPFTPEFQGIGDFKGIVTHPQTWPEDLDYAGKKVAVIGSGATAVTLVPSMAEQAAKVTMVQRTPTYLAGIPSDSAFFGFLKNVAPKTYYGLNRWSRFLLEGVMNSAVKAFPEFAKQKILEETKEKLAGTNVQPKDYIPPYAVWDQRVAAVPDDDWFEAVQKGKVDIVTGHIERFTEGGLLMKDGTEVPADVVVTATGMNVQRNLPFSTMSTSVGGQPVVSSTRMIYKGCMLTGVPNMAFCFGYLRAGSWTQKSDLTAVYVCRLLKHLRSRNLSSCVPVRDPEVREVCMHDFSSSYLMRVKDDLPKAGSMWPWDRPEDFLRDWYRLGYASLIGKDLQFRSVAALSPAAPLLPGTLDTRPTISASAAASPGEARAVSKL